MPDQYRIILTTGILTLIGVIVGGLIPFLVEVYRRKWSVSDRQYERRKQVLDHRCNQAEEYAQAATADFRKVMHDAESNLLDPDDHRAAKRVENQHESKEHLDTMIFSLGPSIRALGDEELKHAWDNMMLARDKLNTTYIKSGIYRFQGDTSIEPMSEYNAVQEIWLEYTRHLGDFYKSLDRVRSAILREN